MLHAIDPMEMEATLAICSEHAAAIAQSIAEISRVATYGIIAGPRQSILDSYFDTPDGALASRNWALRLRETEETRLIALKGPSTHVTSGGVQRVELEIPWSTEALERIRREISALPIDVGQMSLPVDNSLEEALREAGLRIIQQRNTRRQVLNVLSEEGQAIAEIALDEVEYRVRACQVFHNEVEIEAKGPGGAEAVAAVRAYLLQEFRPSVRPWDYGKLATGIALEALLDEAPSEDLFGANGHLTPAAYDKLEARMK